MATPPKKGDEHRVLATSVIGKGATGGIGTRPRPDAPTQETPTSTGCPLCPKWLHPVQHPTRPGGAGASGQWLTIHFQCAGHLGNAQAHLGNAQAHLGPTVALHRRRAVENLRADGGRYFMSFLPSESEPLHRCPFACG